MARPNLSYLKNSVLFVVGLPCGALTGLTGMGASVLVQPLLRYLLGLRVPRLSATALIITCVAALSAMLSYAQHGHVHWLLALIVLVGQTWGALLGGRVVLRAPGLLRQHWLWALFVVALGLLMCHDALQMGLHPSFVALAALPYIGIGGVALLAAVLAGILSAWTGLGGALIVPVLIFAAGLSPLAAQGTAIVTLLLASLPGALVHGTKREVEPQAGSWMGLGAVCGGLVGAFYAVSHHLRAPQLVFVYGVVLSLLGVSLLWRKTEPAALPTE